VTVFDDRIARIAAQFEDFRQAQAQGAVKRADTAEDLARMMGLPGGALTAVLDGLSELYETGGGSDDFGRRFRGEPLRPPYCAVKVTGALFHTQGGIAVTPEARAIRQDGAPSGRLFAAGGAAVGVSGSGDSGYLSGNGLLSAVVLGRIAGRQPLP
jgi:fumarate reductase flavoprotein subunit